MPDYSRTHDPFLLPDMAAAVERLARARKEQEKITIYGDYDIDGLTATVVLLDALKSFGFEHVNVFMPNRFVEGYGLTVKAIEKIASNGAELIITVDCGSQSEKEINRANELGVDIIVTDHHSIGPVLPSAIAVINPKRPDSQYPFGDLAGVGVAFKLIQAMQTRMKGLQIGQEKWLLDLVALGTVCDIVTLVDENRLFVYWGLRVLSQTKRPGLRALMAVSRIDPRLINARSLGFGLGPRMNAAGRLETAQHALDLLVADDSTLAFEKAQALDELNLARKIEQSKIMKEATAQAEKYNDDPVLILSGANWNHGIVGIVAAKLMEQYRKPVFVLQEMGEKSKGSGRSFGDFSAVEVVRSSEDIIFSGGGHHQAAGVTLPTKNIADFRTRTNQLYKAKKLADQRSLLLPSADATADLVEITEELVGLISHLEPFGNGNPQPVLKSNNLLVKNVRRMGTEAQHVKLELESLSGQAMQFIAFSAPEHFFVDPGMRVTIWYHVDINEWQGQRSVEGKLLHLEVTGE